MKMYHNPYKQYEFQQNLKPHKSHPELYYTRTLEIPNSTNRDRLKTWKNEKSQVYPSMVRDEKQFDKLQVLRKSHTDFQYNSSQPPKKHVSKIILPPLLSTEKLASYKLLNHDETSAFSKVRKENKIQPKEQNSRSAQHKVSSHSYSGNHVSSKDTKRISNNVFVTLQPKNTIKSQTGSKSSVTSSSYFVSPTSTLSRGEVVSMKSNYTGSSTVPNHHETCETPEEKTRIRPSKIRGRKKLSVFVNNHSVALARGKAISLSLGNIPEAVELDINNNETCNDAIITYINRENGTASNSTGSTKENADDQRTFAVAHVKADSKQELHGSSYNSMKESETVSNPVMDVEIQTDDWKTNMVKHQSDVSKAAIKSATVGSPKKSRPTILKNTKSLEELEPNKDLIKEQKEANMFRMQFGDCPLPLPKNCLKHSRLLTMEFDFIKYLDLWRLSSNNFGFNLGFGLCDDKRHYTHIIKGVEPGSVGDKAGVKAGNIILAVNHLNVETLNHDQMLKVWKSRGQNVKLHTIQSWAYQHYAKRCHPCATCYTDHALFLDNEEKNTTPGTPVIPHRSIITRSAKKSTTEKVKDTGTVDWLYVGAPGPIYPTFDCPSCHERYNHEGAIEIDKCYHRFCGKCLVQAVKNAKDITVRCPYPSCKQEIKHKQMAQFLTYDELEQFLRISLRLAERHMLNTFYCRTPGCPGYYIMVPGATKFKCPVCDQLNCLTCREIHPGITCNKYMLKRGTKAIEKTEKAMDKMSKYKKAVRCPGCGYIVRNNGDSDNMICTRCKRSFKVSGRY